LSFVSWLSPSVSDLDTQIDDGGRSGSMRLPLAAYRHDALYLGIGGEKNYLGFTERIMTVMFSKSFTGSSKRPFEGQMDGSHKLEDLLHAMHTLVFPVIFRARLLLLLLS
jgi:hypothetical protein